MACCLSTAFATQPNIVVINADDAGYNEFGFNAALNGLTTEFQTPNLDALAAQGVVAKQAYSVHPLCSASRAGLLTGQYPQRFGFEYNIVTQPSFPFTDTSGFSANEVLIGTHLKNQGYATGMVGKWHTGYIQGVNVPTAKGFDEFFGTWSGARWYFEDFRQASAIRRGDTFYEQEYLDKKKFDGTTCTNCEANDTATGRRYVTDAFGEEGADFVKRHANQASPFFLYMAPTAPHDPYQAKQQDFDLFPNVDPNKRVQIAMTYALDRAVGKVLKALDDPNGDGNMSDSVRNNTIVIFTNDNGGLAANDNRPLKGTKGLAFEGGIRVPYIISAPGLQPGVYNSPISALDILPTAYAAAGGNVGQLDTNGVNLMPYLTGNATGAPHEILYFRNIAIWGMRKGDWKFGAPASGAWALYNLATDPGETTNVLNENLDLVTNELMVDFTAWEAKLEKPKWGASQINPFDHFVFRSQNYAFANTTSGSIWLGYQNDPNAGVPVTVYPADIYANTTLEFPVKNGGNYYINNDRVRLSGMHFMLSEMKFTGNFTTGFNCSAGFGGLPYVFVKDLHGNSPKLRLDATSSGTTARFLYSYDTDLLLVDDLEITGNGTQDFRITGGMKDYGNASSVRKTGTAALELTGKNTFTGNFSIEGGSVKVTGAGAISGANTITIANSATLAMQNGLIAVQTINNSAGGTLQVTGGELRVVDIVGNLNNQGANYVPGTSPTASTVSGNLNQSNASSKLSMQIAGTNPGVNYDQLTVGGSATIGGALQLELLPSFFQQTGDVYTLINAAGGVSGTFSNMIMPALSGGRSWQLIYGVNTVQIMISATGGWNGLEGDFDRNGIVDTRDYVVWRKSLGASHNLLADSDGDGVVEVDDLQVWNANFGRTGPAAGEGSVVTAAVPEPNGLILTALAGLIVKMKAHRRRKVECTAPQSLEPPTPIPGGHQPARVSRSADCGALAMATATGLPPW